MSPTQQNGWLLTVQHTLCVTNKLSVYLSNKVEKKGNKMKKKTKSVTSLRFMDDFFFPTNDFSLLESCQLHIITMYKASNCCKIEAVIQKCSVKKVFLKIL